MPFSAYKDLSAVLKEFEIIQNQSNFIIETPFEISPYFREHLGILLEDGVVDNSEYAICESIIAPILQEIWKQYRSKFILWSHQTLRYEDPLSGIPEFSASRCYEVHC
ncbi:MULTISPECIES: hypothetical protein [unclassified Roseofilum]|uniref:hypothetical protein n=1 Tax=unclassified Roseofilum TaxID=2620099 RepID=UPI001B2E913D|nr:MULTISPECIES: hypothetical protein [unclassified Roseofilum]MBP0009675.1 hypothetical protein [Roseofilum sp. Belize Diploria]MBP0035798.1 hypothetical protein [Roseofilum sp. Belize BBD 4]